MSVYMLHIYIYIYIFCRFFSDVPRCQSDKLCMLCVWKTDTFTCQKLREHCRAKKCGHLFHGTWRFPSSQVFSTLTAAAATASGHWWEKEVMYQSLGKMWKVTSCFSVNLCLLDLSECNDYNNYTMIPVWKTRNLPNSNMSTFQISTFKAIQVFPTVSCLSLWPYLEDLSALFSRCKWRWYGWPLVEFWTGSKARNHVAVFDCRSPQLYFVSVLGRKDRMQWCYTLGDKSGWGRIHLVHPNGPSSPSRCQAEQIGAGK